MLKAKLERFNTHKSNLPADTPQEVTDRLTMFIESLQKSLGNEMLMTRAEAEEASKAKKPSIYLRSPKPVTLHETEGGRKYSMGMEIPLPEGVKITDVVKHLWGKGETPAPVAGNVPAPGSVLEQADAVLHQMQSSDKKSEPQADHRDPSWTGKEAVKSVAPPTASGVGAA